MKYILLLVVPLIQGLNLCTTWDTDLCIGVSGLTSGKNIAGVPVQLKSRYNSLVYDAEQRMQFIQDENNSLIFTFENQTMFLDKADKGSSLAILSKRSEGAKFEDGRVTLFNGTRCLTVMRCGGGGGGFCDPGEDKIAKEGTFRKGAYLNFLPCISFFNITGVGAQLFSEDPPCKPGCTDDMLLDDICDQECNYKECFWDFNSCNGTYSPTRGPTTPRPTKRTSKPSRLPTSNPVTSVPTSATVNSSAPSASPSKSTTLLSLVPTSTPSLQAPVTVSPSSLPSPHPTLSSPPSQAPSSQLSPSPTSHPQENTLLPSVTPTQSPSLPPSLPVSPEGGTTTLSPTSHETPQTPYFDLGWIALIVVLFLVIVVIGVLGVRYYYQTQEKRRRTVGNEQPNYPGPLPSPGPSSPRRVTIGSQGQHRLGSPPTEEARV